MTGVQSISPCSPFSAEHLLKWSGEKGHLTTLRFIARNFESSFCCQQFPSHRSGRQSWVHVLSRSSTIFLENFTKRWTASCSFPATPRRMKQADGWKLHLPTSWSWKKWMFQIGMWCNWILELLRCGCSLQSTTHKATPRSKSISSSLGVIAGHGTRILHHVAFPVKTCQNMSKHVKTCQNMSKHVKTCQDMSNHVKTCQKAKGRRPKMPK